MATKNNLPPQAYTREVLAQAYNWLKSQPPSVRERATSADALVSLYLHSRRHGTQAVAGPGVTDVSHQWETEAPVGGENFKADLKDLAMGLREFDSPPLAHHPGPQIVPPQPELHEPDPTPLRFKQEPPPQQPNTISMKYSFEEKTHTRSASIEQTVVSATESLDARSQALLKEVRERLNLGSDAEALRMLITLGFERLREVLPPQT